MLGIAFGFCQTTIFLSCMPKRLPSNITSPMLCMLHDTYSAPVRFKTRFASAIQSEVKRMYSSGVKMSHSSLILLKGPPVLLLESDNGLPDKL